MHPRIELSALADCHAGGGNHGSALRGVGEPPAPEAGVPIGGPSVAIGPDGEILVETTDPIAVATLDRRRVRTVRQDYPGYLPQRADLYALGWARVAAEIGPDVEAE